MAKLTLSVDDEVVARAKEYAKLREVSVSRLVEDYLTAVARPAVAQDTPVLNALRGILKGADLSIDDYRQHLADKHR